MKLRSSERSTKNTAPQSAGQIAFSNTSGPISYAVDGKQYIVGTGAGVMFAFALPD